MDAAAVAVRALRFWDLADDDEIRVSCPCSRIVVYGRGSLQRHRPHLPSDFLIYDLQFRLRCTNCNRHRGFRIAVCDSRANSDKQVDPKERVIVAGDPPDYPRPVKQGPM